MKLKNKKTGEIVEVESLYLTQTQELYLNYINEENKQKVYTTDKIASFNLDWEDYEEPDEIWYIDWQGDVRSADIGNEWGREKEIGNYFETKEEAEKAVEKLKAWKRLQDKGISLHLQKQFRGDGIGYSRTIYTDFTKDSQEIVKDLDLLFGDQE